MRHDQPLLGIALMLAFTALAPIGDAIAKVLGQSIPVGQLVLVRFAVQAALLVPFVLVVRGGWKMPRAVLALVMLRTALHVGGIGAMVTALIYLPLADAVAITFVMPFMMLALGHLLHGEQVGPVRLWACIAGFGGALLVIQPSFAAIGWPALLPLLVAVLFALFMLVTRHIAHQVSAVELQAASGLAATVVIAPVLVLLDPLEVTGLHLVSPTALDWSLLLAIGLLGTFAHLLMTWALRYAPASTVAPLQYLEIPFAAAIGLAVFGNWPSGAALVGIVIIIAAGLTILYREHASAAPRAARRPAAPIVQPAE